MNDDTRQSLEKPSEILRRPEHAEHWYRDSWRVDLMRPANSHLEPVRCMCAAEILVCEAMKDEDMAAAERRGLLGGKESIVAFAWGVSEEVVIQGIGINDELPPDLDLEFRNLRYAISLGRNQEEIDNAKRKLYDFVRALAPERLEAVAAHYERHGF